MKKAATIKKSENFLLERKNRGIIHLPILVGILAVIGVVVSATAFGAVPPPLRRLGLVCKFSPNSKACKAVQCEEGSVKDSDDRCILLEIPSPGSRPRPSKGPSPNLDATPEATPSSSPGSGGGVSYTYKQPQGKYTITLPGDWIVNKTTTISAYSTTKFTGSNGYVAITFGSGKDPIGGCSETSNIALADRTIAGCYLLQKDGSQILTRAYTKDKAGVDFTIEAYINSPLSTNKPVVLDVIETIDIE